MKKNIFNIIYATILGFFFIALLFSCKEVGPEINLTENAYETFIETPETPQDKIVLIEDFTGAACVNCPEAHEAIAAAIAAHPGRVAAIAEYNYFGDPLYIDQILLTPEAEALDDDYLGPVSGHPASFIDRVDFSSDGYLAEPPENIGSYATQRLSEVPPCNIYAVKNYDAATRTLNLTVTIKYTSDVNLTNHISVALAESGIIAAQIVSGVGEVEDYVHNHVLRKMLTYYAGDNLPEDNVAGRVYVFEYSTVLAENWNAENMTAIIFVHNFESDNKEVLQAAEISVTD